MNQVETSNGNFLSNLEVSKIVICLDNVQYSTLMPLIMI